MKHDTSAAKPSGKSENRPGVTALGLWIKYSVIGKCSFMGASAVMVCGGNRAFKILKATCFQGQHDGGKKS